MAIGEFRRKADGLARLRHRIPIQPLPLVRLFYVYGGEFEVAQTPVTFQEEYGGHVTKGSDLLIFH